MLAALAEPASTTLPTVDIVLAAWKMNTDDALPSASSVSALEEMANWPLADTYVPGYRVTPLSSESMSVTLSLRPCASL
jgi:hypothetical protein